MSKFSALAGAALIVTAGCAYAWAADGKAASSIPDFSNNNSAWLKTSNLWLDPPAGNGLGPLHTDPAHPFRNRGVDTKGRDDSGSGRVGDWHDPNLKPVAVAQVKKWGDEEAKGHIQTTASAGCFPTGVPGMHLMNEPLYILQTPKEVTMMWQRGPYIRHIAMNVPHSKNPKPTWDGESVGHYEGDTLVIDTIAFKKGAQLDHFGVTNSAKLHVVEHIKIVNGGKDLQALFTVDDPDVYNHPWTGMMLYRHVKSVITESICAENNMDYFTGKMYPLPTATKADF
jgi:hypothetical protein